MTPTRPSAVVSFSEAEWQRFLTAERPRPNLLIVCATEEHGELTSVDLRRPAADRNNPEIVIGGCGFDLVVIRGVANLLPVGREGVVVLSAERKHRRIVVTGREVTGNRKHSG